MSELLLLEGGVAGHMNHLYDNPSLTFGQLKDIFVKASGGQLLGTEKTDGINLFLSYSVKDGEAKAARNKGNIKSGGLNAEQLAAKFAERGSLTDSFRDAFTSWSEAIRRLNPQTQMKIFGQDAEIYYNAEIQDPGSPNVINYDTRNLVIHQTGHAFFDRESGKVSDVDVSQNYKILAGMIDKAQKSEQGGSFRLINNAVRTIKAMEDKKPLQDALARLEKVQAQGKMKDNQSIADYVSNRLALFLKKSVPGLTPGTVQAIADKILGLKGLNISKIMDKVPDEQKEKVKAIANNADSVMKEIIAPVESIVHDFSVEVLKGLESAFMLDNRKEVDRLRQETSTAIKAIQNSGNEDAIKILNHQLKKLKGADRIYTAAEGFVFTYDGMTYKFTGNFAPINQILGLFKYGRGNIPPLRDIVKESAKNRIIALLPGGYKPPHVGHYLGAKYFASIKNIDEVRVIISPKERTDASGRVVVDAQKSLKIWQIFVKGDPKIKPMISRVSSPVRDVYDTIAEMNPGDTLLLGKGEKETEADTRFDRAQDWANKNNPGVTVKPTVTKVDQKLQNVSASGLRELIATGKQQEFYKYMPPHLSSQEKDMIWVILTGAGKETEPMEEHIVKSGDKYCLKSKKTDKNLGCYPSKGGAEHREKQVQYFKHLGEEINIQTHRGSCESVHPQKEHAQWLEEMSSGAGGSAQGGGTPFFMKKRQFESILMDRHAVLEEILLREHIRNTIKQVFEYRVDETTALIKLIRESILTEAKSNVSDTVHSSTGINVLEDCLKKIIPQMEQDYKTLTTSKEQRESFRAHILNAVTKTLTAADINQNADSEENGSMNLAEMVENPPLVRNAEGPPPVEEVSVNVGDQPAKPGDEKKFIDINKKPKDSEEEDTFTIAGKDVTGRNMAQMTYDKIEKNIVDSYGVLSDAEDKKLFYDYLLTNLKLYFDKFESEIETEVQEPEVNAEPDAGGETAPAPTGEEPTL